jgi:hypothetical protein
VFAERGSRAEPHVGVEGHTPERRTQRVDLSGREHVAPGQGDVRLGQVRGEGQLPPVGRDRLG